MTTDAGRTRRIGIAAGLCGLALAAALGLARAAEDEEAEEARSLGLGGAGFGQEREENEAGEGRRLDLGGAAYREECGACHVAYPPGLLSAASWRALMGGLRDHFGVDASLDPETERQIAARLVAGASRRPSVDALGLPVRRISETMWFRRAHRPGHEGLDAAVFSSPAVRSPANCDACHLGAAAGDYHEDGIRIPRAGG